MDTQLNLTPNDVAALVQLAEKRQLAKYSTEKLLTSAANKALHATLLEMWPMAGKKRSLRLGIMSALLGKPIATTKDLHMHEACAILEVLHAEETRKYFGRSGIEELQIQIEGSYFGRAWELPATRID